MESWYTPASYENEVNMNEAAKYKSSKFQVFAAAHIWIPKPNPKLSARREAQDTLWGFKFHLKDIQLQLTVSYRRGPTQISQGACESSTRYSDNLESNRKHFCSVRTARASQTPTAAVSWWQRIRLSLKNLLENPPSGSSISFPADDDKHLFNLFICQIHAVYPTDSTCKPNQHRTHQDTVHERDESQWSFGPCLLVTFITSW